MTWQEIIVTLVGIILTGLASWLVAWLTSLINTKIKDEKLRSCFNSALEVVGRTVKVTYQTFVSNMKGTDKWTDETKKEALQMAIDAARSQLSTEIQSYIVQNGTSIDEWLRQEIEAQIYNLKAQNSKRGGETDETA